MSKIKKNPTHEFAGGSSAGLIVITQTQHQLPLTATSLQNAGFKRIKSQLNGFAFGLFLASFAGPMIYKSN